MGSVVLTGFIIYLPLFQVWPVMFKQIIFETLDHGTSMNLPYFHEVGEFYKLFKIELRGWLAANGSGDLMMVLYCFGNLVRAGFLYLLPFLISIASLGLIFNSKIRHFEKILISFFILWGVTAFLKALGRSDMAHLVHSVTPFVILLVILIKNYRSLFFRVSLILLLILLFLPLPLKMLHIKNTLKLQYYPVVSENGFLMIDDEGEAESVDEIIQFVLENTNSGDFIFVTPWFSPPIYALTDRKNPTYYDSLIDLVARPSEEKQRVICEDLIEKKTKLVIHSSDWGFDEKPELQFSKTGQILDGCIRENFRFMKNFGRYGVYVIE